MRIILLTIGMVLAGLRVEAATYYVRADGTVTAANKANATSPNDASTSLNRAQYAAATFSAGDVILFSSQGGQYTDGTVSAILDGTSEAWFELGNVPGETPVINRAGSSLGFGGKSYVKIHGFNCINSSSSGTTSLLTTSSASHDVEMYDIGYINSVPAGYTFNVSGTETNWFVHDCRFTNSPVKSIYFYGATNSGLTFSNIVLTGCGTIDVANVTGQLTFANVTQTNAVAGGATQFYVHASSGASLLMTNCLCIDSPAGVKGYYLLSNDFTNAVVGGCQAVNLGDTGFVHQNTSGTLYSACLATNCAGNGWTVYGIPGVGTNLVWTNCAAFNQTSSGRGWLVRTNADTMTFYGCSAVSNANTGFEFDGTAGLMVNSGLTNCLSIKNSGNGYSMIVTGASFNFQSCQALTNNADGFSTTDYFHDVAYQRCLAFANGRKTDSAASSGDGFTAHATNYNITLSCCIAASNTISGLAFIGDSEGIIENCTFVRNGGNWTEDGQYPSERGGMYFSISIANPITGKTWAATNNICFENWPFELRNNMTDIGLDYNCYSPMSTNLSAFTWTGDTAPPGLDWATYHGSHEMHSIGVDPRFATGTYIPIWCSGANDKGTDVGFTSDYLGNPILGAPDIGAYEYQRRVKLVTVAGKTIVVPE